MVIETKRKVIVYKRESERGTEIEREREGKGGERERRIYSTASAVYRAPNATA